MTDLELELDDIPLTRRDPMVDAEHETSGELVVSGLEEITRTNAALLQSAEYVVSALRSLEIPGPLDLNIEERAAIVDLYWTIKGLADHLYHRKKAIEYAWSAAFEQLGSAKLPLGEGKFVTYSPASEYEVDGPTLRKELLSLAERGLLTTDEVDDAIAPVVTYKANHTKLNAFLRRGTEVAEVIESCRTRKVPTGATATGKITFPKR
jgi:hypothetical protein